MGMIMNVPVAAQSPLSPAARQLADAAAREEAAAKKVWKAAVVLAADGKGLTDKQLDGLAAARFTLGRPPELFDRHVAAWRDYQACLGRHSALPPQAEQDAQLRALKAKAKALAADIDRLKAELRQTERQYQALPMHWSAVTTQFEAAAKACGELLAAD